jgi:arylsulfatase A-like enzyme
MSYDEVAPEVLREARAAYLGLVTQCDYAMGRVLAALDENGLDRDTLVICTSDHGDFLGDCAAGAKNHFYDCAARVPFLVRPPPAWGLDLAGAECPALACHSDVPATILAAAGGRIPGDWDGHDLLAVARGQAPGRALLDGIGETNPPSRPAAESQRAWIAITDGDWKYLWYPEGGVQQLFHLPSDPREERERSADPACAPHLERLRAALIARHQQEDYRRHGYVRDGRLVALPLAGDTTRERRARPWPSLLTGAKPSDVKH